MKRAIFCGGPEGELRGETHLFAWGMAALLADLALAAIQLFLCFHFNGPQVSDARSYIELAQYCAENQTWYPGERDMFALYIFGNGYVNLLSAIMRLTPQMIWVFLLNAVFTQVIVLTTADMAYQLTGRRKTAYMTVVLLCMMGGLWGEAPSARTELCFMALANLSLCLMLRRRTGALLLSGVLMGLANWVRPLLVIYLPAALLYFVMQRVGVRRVLAYLAGIALVIVLVGAGAYQRTGKFVYQAQTMGVNMLMGANDDADGSYVAEVYDEGKAGYVPDGSGMTFDERDAHYRSLAIEWIIGHLPRFIAIAPVKLFYFLATDTYGGSAFFNNEIQTDNLAYLMELGRILMGQGERPLALGDAVVVFSQLTYMLVFFGYLAFVVHGLRRRCWLRLLPLHLIFALACGVTVLTVGGARYHMPYLPIFCLCTAMLVDCRVKKGGKAVRAEVTASSRSTHCRASWASVCPRRAAMAESACVHAQSLPSIISGFR